MRRVRITTNYKKYKAGDVIEVSNNEAFGLIDRGVAVIAKDIVVQDYKVKKVKRV